MARKKPAKKAKKKTAAKAAARKSAKKTVEEGRQEDRQEGSRRRPAKKAAEAEEGRRSRRRKAAAKKAAPSESRGGRPPAEEGAPPKKAAAAKAAARRRQPKKPNLDRPRKTVADIHGIPSSLDMDRSRLGRQVGPRRHEETGSRRTPARGPALTAGDVDADWESAETVGDEAPGGDNPTPDQDVVDDIGRALGVEYQDDEELQGGAEIADRDRIAGSSIPRPRTTTTKKSSW